MCECEFECQSECVSVSGCVRVFLSVCECV